LYPNNLIRPYQTGNHPDGTTDEEGETTKKSAVNDSDVTSEKFDGYVASYLKDVFVKRHECSQSLERLISKISEDDDSWTDEDSLLKFAYAVICCAARAFVAQPKRKHGVEEEGKIISRSDKCAIILSYL